MFKFNELQQIHLEITNNCQASCPMCNRNVNSGLDNPLIKIQNWTLDEFKQIMSPVFAQINSYYFCGNFGDPILNNDLLAMCRYSKNAAPDVKVTIHTNGGARTTEWWIDLASALPNDHLVVFALDGLEDTHHLYRVGTTFDNVVRNAKSFIRAGGRAEWVFIRFKHNEHQVETARQLAKDWGFEKFTVKNSSRFILEPTVAVLDKQGKLMHSIEPATDTPIKFINKTAIDSYKKIVSDSEIVCKVQQGREVYIDAYKNLYPCCWIASVPYSYIEQNDAFHVRNEILNQHNDLMSKLGNTSAMDRTVEEIVNSDSYQTVWQDYWTDQKLITCARTCGVAPSITFSQPKDQIVNV